jgi:hypothetical protein
MQFRAAGFLACLVVASAVLLAQPLDRLSGRVFGDASAPLADADVRVEAIFGFAGGDFLGQRAFATRTNGKGEWALLAFKSASGCSTPRPRDACPTPSPCRSISWRRPVPESIGSRLPGIRC